ncbi:glycosylated lysosomal membrane protein-like [Macrosteles quadrilineatus]|uniref:glycosylated lysosomal membrane protein-like n=1 Tax=Macrosteles quadrilineatus TaxID=74068 RepID=UPI0023E2AA07|nr:glycosylated lysosomal membrane protein-like [Macrosteles quadrilineatus]
MIIVSLILMLVIFSGVDCERKITAKLNPGCDNPSLCKDAILVHVKAEGLNDTLHHIWDFTWKPSLLLALTEKNTTLNIQWSPFLAGNEDAVKFDSVPKYVYGVVLDKMIEFNDADDTGYLNETNSDSSYISLLDTKNFNWKLSNLTNTSGEATLTVVATDFKDNLINLQKNGTVQITLSAYGAETHGEPLPHLLHSGNASQVDLIINGLSPQYNRSRYGLGLLAVSSDSRNSTLPSVNHRKTLDDEHAPGVFTIEELLTPAVHDKAGGGYLQWRPIVYFSDKREMTNSTETVQYHVVAPTSPRSALNHSLLFSALGPQVDDMLTIATNVTFGVAKDGFYNKNQYAAWTMVAGYGQPPEEHFSMLVMLVLLIGLGLPAIVILTGTVCLVVRRLQRNKDDFFLSR